jgi:hypothetical protein
VLVPEALLYDEKRARADSYQLVNEAQKGRSLEKLEKLETSWEKQRHLWKHRVESDFIPEWVGFDSDYHNEPDRRIAFALERIAWELGQIDRRLGTPKLDKDSSAQSG